MAKCNWIAFQTLHSVSRTSTLGALQSWTTSGITFDVTIQRLHSRRMWHTRMTSTAVAGGPWTCKVGYMIYHGYGGLTPSPRERP